MGVAGQQDSPVLIEAIERVLARAKAHGVATAIQAHEMSFACCWVEQGMAIISYSSEIAILTAAAAGIINSAHAARV